MAFHDPDSNLREHAMALKVGRQKRIQVIDGQQVEVYSGIDDEEYEGESDYEEYIDGDMDDSDDDTTLVSPKIEKTEGIVAVGDDGQRYMVVEVINMEDEEQLNSQDVQQQQKDGVMEIEELILPERKSTTSAYSAPNVLHFHSIELKFNCSGFGWGTNWWCADRTKDIWQSTGWQRYGRLFWIWGKPLSTHLQRNSI